MSDLPIAFRPMRESDTAFIFSTWLKSYRHSSFAKDMSNDVFFNHHKEIISSILKSSNITLLVNDTDADQIYGYAAQQMVGTTSITHFVYVKYNFRKLGFASKLAAEMKLFPDDVNFITHLPRYYSSLKSKYGLEYNPYILSDLT